MSLDFMEEVFVKEEYMVVESDIDFNQLHTADQSRKCGEVFLGHRGDFTFACALCLKTYPDLRNFGEHIRNVHQSPTSTFTEVNDFGDQILLPIKNEPLTQDQADAEPAEQHNNTQTEDELITKDSTGLTDNELCEEHNREPQLNIKQRKPKSPNKSYCCFSCGKIFNGFYSYRRHYRSVHPDMVEKDASGTSKQRNFIPKLPEEMLCKVCLNTFDDPATYHTHMETAHISNASKLYTCNYCSKTFKTNTSLRYHIDTHERKKPYKCSHCPKAFSNPSNLRTHLRMHLNIRPYSCQYCDQKFTTKSDCIIHERIHTNERPFQCDECGNSFVSRGKLTKHIEKHRDIRNFKCSNCDKTFFNGQILHDHMITHTGERPYNCDICNKKFRAKSALRSHKMLHSDTKRYECELCGKTFAQRPGLYSHMKSHGDIVK